MKTKKLTLNTETICTLIPAELEGARGGTWDSVKFFSAQNCEDIARALTLRCDQQVRRVPGPNQPSIERVVG